MGKKQILISDSNVKDLVSNAILHCVFSLKHDDMPDYVFKLFLNEVSIQSMDDQTLLKDKRIRQLIDWSKIDRKQLIRLMTRDLTILNQLDFDLQQFTITELEMFLRFHPEYVGRLNIDFDNLTSKECIVLLNIDSNACEFIDFQTIKFTRIDMQYLVRKFIHNERIMNNLNFNLMDNYIKRYILKKTNLKYLNNINLDSFNSLDWEDLIQKNPNFYKLCNPERFIKGDCSFLVNIANCVTEVYDLIVENKDKISAHGWEKLLLLDLKKYSPICNWAIMHNLNFKILKKTYPDIEKYHPRYSRN